MAILALHFLLHASPEAAAPLRAPLVAALVPWAMHHNHGVKTLSLLVLKVLRPAFHPGCLTVPVLALAMCRCSNWQMSAPM